MFFSAQIYLSLHKYVFQYTNIFSSAQICFSAQIYFSVHKYIFQCTNIFFSAQMYFSVHKYVFQCTNMIHCTNIFFSSQMYFSVQKYSWKYSWNPIGKNGRKTLGLECHWGLVALFAALSSQIESIFDRSRMFCRNYGKGLEVSFAFCPNCGAKVESEVSLSFRDNTVGSVSLALTSQTSCKRSSPS